KGLQRLSVRMRKRLRGAGLQQPNIFANVPPSDVAGSRNPTRARLNSITAEKRGGSGSPLWQTQLRRIATTKYRETLPLGKLRTTVTTSSRRRKTIFFHNLKTCSKSFRSLGKGKL